jgi:methionyl-tRNA formyltransferase
VVRAAFLGTPSAAIPPLIALMEVADVDLVVTRPDAPKGRSKRPQPPPVKLAAQEFGLEVAQPATRDELFAVMEGAGVDLGLVVAYGRILPPSTLATTRFGFINVHFSLLPLWRGAAPVERAILAGDETTGVSLMLMEEGLDTGPVIAAAETEIAPDDTGGSLTAALASLGADLVLDHLVPYTQGQRDPAPQLDRLSTYAGRLTKEEARIVGGTPAEVVERMVRAFHPRPGAWVTAGGIRYRILEAHLAAASVVDGTVEVQGDRVFLGSTEGVVLEIDRIQPAGKRVMTAVEFANGHRGAVLTLDP